MMPVLGRMRSAALGAVAAAAMLAAAGCAPSFYLSESEVNAYLANLQRGSSANDLLRHFQGQVIRIEFTAATPTPRIRSTNILTVLRAIPELFFIEQGFRQIRLDRLSTQLEEQLDVWIAERLYFLLRQGGGRVRLEQLDRVFVRILSAPTLSYDPDRLAVSFDLTVRVDLYGTLEVSELLSDGHYALHVVIDNYRLRGGLQVPPASAADAWVRLVVNPQPGNVSVEGDGSDDLKSQLSQLLHQQLASPVDETRVLSYENFAVSGVRLESTAQGARLEAIYRSRPEIADPILDSVIRGADGALYHARRRGGGWDAPVATPVGNQIASDPALVASGPDQLELVAVERPGNLIHAGWRSGTWGSIFRTPSQGQAIRFSPARPALVATAPGQLEIVAPGTDGRLYHLRRLNGRWSQPSAIANPAGAGSLPLRYPLTLQVGNKIVLVYGDSQNRIFAAAFDLEAAIWGQAFEIPSQGTPFPVAAAACSDGRVDVVHVRADGAVVQRQLDVQSVNFRPRVATTGLSYRPEVVIGGQLAAGPTLTCSGYRRMELAGQGMDHRLWHNHFSPGPVGLVDGRPITDGWQGWAEVSDRLFGTLSSGNIAGTIAAVSTRAGEVHVAVLQGTPPRSGGGHGGTPQAVTRQPVLYNSYDSSRFGHAPWKAVHWRGFERMGALTFVGNPALAVSGRQLELTAVGNDGNLWHSRLADGGLAEFRAMPDTTVRFPFEPVVLSSGPGLVDVLYPGAHGGPRHLRRSNGFAVRNVALAVPAGLVFASPVTAVSFGVGQIELVGLAQDHTLHHWRYRGGVWEPPRPIPGTAISAPVLVNVGAGQLELLAIGSNQRLHHWRFLDAQWTAPRQLFSSSALSAVLFGPLAATSWGDGTVDVVVVEDRTNRLLHRRIYPSEALPPGRFIEPGRISGHFIEIGGTVIDVPSLTAFSASRLLVVVPGTDGRLYGNWGEVLVQSSPRDRVIVRPLGDPGLRWGGFQSLSTPGLIMGGVVKLSDQDLAAVAVDRMGRIYQARYTGGHWSGFWALPRQTEDVQHRPPMRPALTAH